MDNRVKKPMSAKTDLLPYRPKVEESEREIELVDLDDAGDILDVLSSTTARTILTSLYRNPGPASEIADRVDTSLQNVTYHLRRLRNADLITVVSTWYSSKGLEMDVYAPTKEPLILVAGGEYSIGIVKRAMRAATGDIGSIPNMSE